MEVRWCSIAPNWMDIGGVILFVLLFLRVKGNSRLFMWMELQADISNEDFFVISFFLLGK